VNKTFPEFFDAFAGIAAPVIAIDGPSASGKGTVAQRVADALGFHFLDSGALYRLTALAAMKAGVAPEDEPGVAAIAANLPAEFAGASDSAFGRRCYRGDPGRGNLASMPRKWRPCPPCGPRCWSGNGPTGASPAWSPTAATWRRWSSLRPRSRCF
jgi:hypothetical protein